VKRKNRAPVFGLVALLMGAAVQADPVNFMSVRTDLTVQDNDIEFHTEIPYRLAFPAEDKRTRLVFASNYFDENFIIENESVPCTLSVTNIDSDVDRTVFEGRAVCGKKAERPASIKIHSRLFLDLFSDVNHFVTLTVRGARREMLATRSDPTIEGFGDNQIERGEEPAGIRFLSVMKQFLFLGIPHILFGIDHVLFILAIHSIVRKWKDILIVVTSFTVAHSITLILAGLGVIAMTARVVEPLIAFSIAYTAIRNIIIVYQRKEESAILRERWISTFGFGLVHGMGFAGALAEIKIPDDYFIPALLSFNVGVEIGQLIIIAAFVSVLWIAVKLKSLAETVYGLSGAIGLVSCVWVIQRIVRP
jgi:hydrogenase/urease accessory protein HupE